ncbi:MAG: hypothetical protein H3C43_09860, partial [Leptonema sp. (in: Bacteria)]|nr:hypothetical protein [Leptonema sp. (in: bacteria)]
FNLQRKLYHLLGLSVPIMIYTNIFQFLDQEDPLITRKILILLVVAAIIVLVVMEVLRFNNQRFAQLFESMFGSLMKEAELNRIHGSVSYIISNLILLLFFTDEVIILSLCFLVIADPVAALVGIYFGRLRFWNGKTVEGLFAFIFASFLSGIIFYSIQDLWGRGELPFVLSQGSLSVVFVILAATSIISAFAEFFSFIALGGLIDDNIIVPIAAVTSLYGLSIAFGFDSSIILFNWTNSI